MSIHFIKGNMLDAKLDYYCHQVNCQGRMGSGIAKSIKEKWHRVYDDYIAKCTNREEEIYQMCGGLENGLDWTETLLGEIQVVPVDVDKSVINMFAQQHYGYDGKRYTSYDAFWICLNNIAGIVPKGSKIGFPGRVGCDRGGANWNVIYEMISEVLKEDFEVYIYFLEEDKKNG